MKRTQVIPDLNQFPPAFHSLLENTALFDSSCSSRAKVWFLDREEGFYLKSAPRGTLLEEAALTRYFHSKGLGAEVLSYESLDNDWMLTRRIPGEDCLDPIYLKDPARLCDLTATLLRTLHDADTSGCPVPDRTGLLLDAARRCWETKSYDMSLFPDNWGYNTPEDAWAVLERDAGYLQSDTLLHGDYCLPNIMLDNWSFSGFIDLDTGGVGDRHLDLFWGIWSLSFNLKTDQYRDRFLDVYGRDKVCEDIFPVISALEVFL